MGNLSENHYIKSEYDNSEVLNPTTTNGQKLDSKNDVVDMTNKPKTVYGIVGVQRLVLHILAIRS